MILIPSHIKALSFDAVGTLITPNPSVGAVYSRTMAKHGIALDPPVIEARFRSAFRATRKDPRIEDAEQREYHYWKSIVRRTIEPSEEPDQFDYDAFFDELWRLFATGEPWKPTEGARETLDTLSKRYPLALLTNWDSRARSAFKDLELLAFFQHVIISSEIGFDKPDTQIFASAAKLLGISASELLHVGDSLEEDIEGATNAGCAAAWLGGNTDQKLPDQVIRLSGLSALTELKPPIDNS